MNSQEIKSVVWKEGEQYVAQALNVDVSSFGSSKTEALANIREALDLYFEDASGDTFVSIEEPEIVSF